MVFKNPDFAANDPYYDDFDDAKNFLKILFRPGYAVQARELTQLQTILQSQVAKFADHVFVDGSKVFGGEIQYSSNEFVRVIKTTFNTSGVSTAKSSDLLLKSIAESTASTSNVLKVYRRTGATGSVGTFEELATIRLHFYEPSGFSVNDDYSILFYSINSVGPTVPDGIFEMSRDLFIGSDPNGGATGEFFRVINPSIQSTTPPQDTIQVKGIANLITVNDGIFYKDGYFIKTQKQTVTLYKRSKQFETEVTMDTGATFSFAPEGVRLFAKPSNRIGYFVDRQIITHLDDSTLTDPSRGFNNYAAPGADRYKIDLRLGTIEYDSNVVELDNYVTDNFVQLLRTTRGVTDYVKNNSSYAQLLNLFARRTHDESGSYTIKPFIGEVKNHLRKDKIILTLSDASANAHFDTIKLGGFIYPANQTSFDPYAAGINFTTLTFPVGKVIDIIKDFAIPPGGSAAIRSVKIVCQLLSKGAFTDAQSYRYKFASGPFASGTNGIIVTSTGLQIEIDGAGSYSTRDLPTGDVNKLNIILQPGKAYVKGYEYETFAPRGIEYRIDGEQSETETFINQNVEFVLGNYVRATFASTDTTNPQDGIPDINDVFPTQKVNFEKLPALEMVDEDTATLLLFQTGVSSNARGIHAWSPFKFTNEETQGNVVDMQILTGNESIDDYYYPHESVLFVAYNAEEE